MVQQKISENLNYSFLIR